MPARALLVGSQTYGLAGVNADVALMDETLRQRGFETRVLVDHDATRDAILSAYEQLIADTPKDSSDPVVVYYSGHGALERLDDWRERERRGERSHIRYVVPFDASATTETDFRGILAEHLSDLQRRLTVRTPNVITILDCCYSGTMSRNAGLMPKAMPPRAIPIDDAMSQLHSLLGMSDSGRMGFDDSNALAVRLVACDPLQLAYERRSVLGGHHGVLTEQLAIFLRDLGDRNVSWQALAYQLRKRITEAVELQRPEVEGPSERLLFSLATRSAAGALPLSSVNGTLTLQAAGLFGLSVGDCFRILSDEERELTTATVVRIAQDRAEFELDSHYLGELPTTVLAAPLRTQRTRSVSLKLPADVASVVEASIGGSPLLRVASTNADSPVARIIDDGGLRVLDAVGLAVHRQPISLTQVGAGRAVSIAERMAKAERLRGLMSSAALGPDDLRLGVEFSLHDGTDRVLLNRTGEQLYPGDRISLGITNRSDRTLYVGLLDINTAYEIRLLNTSEPSGWKLPPGSIKLVGGNDGTALVLESAVPEQGVRLESFVVVASTTPQEFGLLQTPRTKAPPGSLSELESLLVEAATGTRAWPVADQPRDDPYRAESIDFFLHTTSRPESSESTRSITGQGVDADANIELGGGARAGLAFSKARTPIVATPEEFVPHLRDGDILVFDKLAPLNRLVQWGDNRPAGHCGVWHDGCVYEATRKPKSEGGAQGVFSTPFPHLMKLTVDDRRGEVGLVRTVTALRHPGADDLHRQAILEYLKQRSSGSQFGIKEMVLLTPFALQRSYARESEPLNDVMAGVIRACKLIAKRSLRGEAHPERLFCSQLVYRAYEHANLDLRIIDPLWEWYYFRDKGETDEEQAKANAMLDEYADFLEQEVLAEPATSRTASEVEAVTEEPTGRSTEPEAVSGGEHEPQWSSKGLFRRDRQPEFAELITPGDFWSSPSLETVAVLHRFPGY